MAEDEFDADQDKDRARSFDTPNFAHPAGSARRPTAELPHLVGHIRGISTEVDSDGDCLLILHLENDYGKTRHAIVLEHDTLDGLLRQLSECRVALSNIESLGEASDVVLEAYDGIWVDAPGQYEPGSPEPDVA